MKWLHYILIRLTLFFVLGILVGFHFNIPITRVAVLFTSVVLLLIILYYQYRKRFSTTVFFSILSYSAFLLLGVITVYLHKEKHNTNHYLHYIKFRDETIVLSLSLIHI